MTDTLTGWLSRAISQLARNGRLPEPDAKMGELGISSLALVTLQYRLQTEHGIAASLEELSRNQTIGALAGRLSALWHEGDIA